MQMPKTRPQRRRRPTTKVMESGADPGATLADAATLGTSRDSDATQPPWLDTLMTTISSEIDRKIQQAMATSTVTPPAPPPEQAVAAPALTTPAQTVPPVAQPEADLQSSIVGPVQESLQGNLLSGSITSQVSAKLKQKIWAGEYVELSFLLEKTDKTDRIDHTYTFHVDNAGDAPAIQLVPHTRKGYPLPLLQWVRAWNRFCAVLQEQSPNLGPLLAHHLETVLNLASKGAAWRIYDEQFRRLISLGEAKWGSAHLELYLKAHLETQAPGKKATTAAVPQTDMPKGACYKYHTSGTCPTGESCKFQHNCFNCMGRHSFKDCQAAITKPFKVMPWFPKADTQNRIQSFPASSSGNNWTTPKATGSQPVKQNFFRGQRQ